MKKLFRKLFYGEETIEIPMKMAMQICRYCEEQQIYNKLKKYGDFYYKLLNIIAEN